MAMKIKNLIVGAGLSWVVIAQQLVEKWEEVFIIEKRGHIGGNCYDYYDENGFLIHKYWPHIFHTNMKDVREYVNRFSEFTTYQHKVLWFIDGNFIPIPFNLNSVYISFPLLFAQELESTLLKYYPYNSKISVGELRKKAVEEKNIQLQFLSDYIFEKVFKNYTMKQRWISIEEISPEVIGRVPIVITRDDRYFPHCSYQGMPIHWYSKMFEKMLNSSKIKLLLNTDYKTVLWNLDYDQLFVTAPIDEYFDFKYGKLEYRKTLYCFKTYDLQSFQEASVINYPNNYEYTRITEMKKFYPMSNTFSLEKTVICKEFPWRGDVDAYPVENLKNEKILAKYHAEAQSLKNVHFLGRLANYKYWDMDKTIKNALDIMQ